MDFIESARCTEPEKTEGRRPPDAEREFPKPAQTPVNRKAVSTGTRETTPYESRHDPGVSWLYKIKEIYFRSAILDSELNVFGSIMKPLMEIQKIFLTARPNHDRIINVSLPHR
ncbi:hypothetical protein NDU88_000661 [Pleurodeles waltl]|uniref:Uncharacterized protein n=1 Tax=Pleurodeles waltl TaxID=8319 RepID=A0AAV7S9A5_PLEWA|nr:hypothetical protein NDU88_000661 [Pleurodeles waltl]